MQMLDPVLSFRTLHIAQPIKMAGLVRHVCGSRKMASTPLTGDLLSSNYNPPTILRPRASKDPFPSFVNSTRSPSPPLVVR